MPDKLSLALVGIGVGGILLSRDAKNQLHLRTDFRNITGEGRELAGEFIVRIDRQLTIVIIDIQYSL
jgi:hypothetical protein